MPYNYLINTYIINDMSINGENLIITYIINDMSINAPFIDLFLIRDHLLATYRDIYNIICVFYIIL